MGEVERADAGRQRVSDRRPPRRTAAAGATRPLLRFHAGLFTVFGAALVLLPGRGRRELSPGSRADA